MTNVAYAVPETAKKKAEKHKKTGKEADPADFPAFS